MRLRTQNMACASYAHQLGHTWVVKPRRDYENKSRFQNDFLFIFLSFYWTAWDLQSDREIETWHPYAHVYRLYNPSVSNLIVISRKKALSAVSVWFRSCWLFIGFRAHLLLQLKLLFENWRKPHKRIIIVEGPDHGMFILLNRKAHFFTTWPSRIPSDSTNADMRMSV